MQAGDGQPGGAPCIVTDHMLATQCPPVYQRSMAVRWCVPGCQGGFSQNDVDHQHHQLLPPDKLRTPQEYESYCLLVAQTVKPTVTHDCAACNIALSQTSKQTLIISCTVGPSNPSGDC